MRGDDKGYIVVETVGAFIPFLLLVISILSLVQIVTVQARVHYALTQAANAMSMYCYALEAAGVAGDLTALDNKAYKIGENASKTRNDIEEAFAAINSGFDIRAAAQHGSDAASRIYGFGEEAAADPEGTMKSLLSYGLDELSDKAFDMIVRPLVGRYLSNGNMTGNEYLTASNVVSKKGASGLDALEFYYFKNFGAGNSELIDKDGNVKIVVRYEVEYTFFGLRLPFRPTLRIAQTVVTKAWLNGSGKGYW